MQKAFVKNTGFNIGCLCRLDLDYMVERPPDGWAQGFAFMYFKRTGFTPTIARMIGNEWVFDGRDHP